MNSSRSARLSFSRDRQAVELVARRSNPTVAYDGGMGLDPATVMTVINTAANLVGLSSLFKNAGKEAYNATKPKVLSIVKAYGPNPVAAAAAAGVDPVLVITALSDYLKDRGVVMTPAQIITQVNARYAAKK